MLEVVSAVESLNHCVSGVQNISSSSIVWGTSSEFSSSAVTLVSTGSILTDWHWCFEPERIIHRTKLLLSADSDVKSQLLSPIRFGDRNCHMGKRLGIFCIYFNQSLALLCVMLNVTFTIFPPPGDSWDLQWWVSASSKYLLQLMHVLPVLFYRLMRR